MVDVSPTFQGECNAISLNQNFKKICAVFLPLSLLRRRLAGIVVQILGIGKCEWAEQRRTFSAEEIYIKDEIKIYESNGWCLVVIIIIALVPARTLQSMMQFGKFYR